MLIKGLIPRVLNELGTLRRCLLLSFPTTSLANMHAPFIGVFSCLVIVFRCWRLDLVKEHWFNLRNFLDLAQRCHSILVRLLMLDKFLMAAEYIGIQVDRPLFLCNRLSSRPKGC